MGKPQIELFPAPPPTADELLTKALAQERLERRLRDETKPGAISYDARRSRRKRAVRAATVNVQRIPKRELELGRAMYPADEHADVQRPRTREDCAGIPRPCPFISCRHHLYLDVSARNGSLKLNFPDLEPDQLPPDRSCTLDIADQHGTTLETVGEILNLTRERVRQIELRALAKAQATREAFILRDFLGDGRPGKRRLPILEPYDGNDEECPKGTAQASGADFDPEEFASEALDSE